jgi:cytochrome b
MTLTDCGGDEAPENYRILFQGHKVSLSFSADTGPEVSVGEAFMDIHELQRKKVFGGVQRLLHAWLGLVVMALVGLGWLEKFMDPGPWRPILGSLHIGLGYGLIVGLVLRMIWGFIGPAEARFSGFFSRTMKRWGHEPFASYSYLLFYLALGIGCLSGLLLAAIEYDRGVFAAQFFDDFTWHGALTIAHDCVAYAVSAFIVLHLGALIFHEKERGYPLAQAMLSGYQYRPSLRENKSHEDNDPSRPDAQR